jgi:carboxymethylenebutenolidase
MPRHASRILVGSIPLLLSALLVGCGSSSEDDYAERMAAEHSGDAPVASAATTADPAKEVEAVEVSYATLEAGSVKGYLARPVDGAEGAPGIIVIQEWWGLNDNIRSMARQLAGQGYAALAVDLYAGRTAADADEARQLMSAAMEREGELEENLRQAYRYLVDQSGAPRVGVIGWCFGGGWSLRTALLLPAQIDAAVIYYGRVVTDRDKLTTLDAPILGIFGGEDRGIPVETVREFEAVLEELGKNVTIHVYEGANHAFANPSGTRYDAEAAEDAWAKTLEFFSANLLR